MPRALALLLALTLACAGAASQSATPATHIVGGPASDADTSAVLLAAGDIAACTQGAWSTARLLDSLPGEILVAGDAAYITSRDPNPYVTCYDTTWGRHKQRTHPVLGNHDADIIRRYFDYFGAAAGRRNDGYYSFDVGRWHILAINSTISTSPRSPQGRWVAADLAAHPAKCTLAFMHHPRFSSGPHGSQPQMSGLFQLLQRAGVDVMIGAHDHIYERFAPMLANGARNDTLGLRQFVVGTGGNLLYEIYRVQRNSEVRLNGDNGILKLTLHPSGYNWEFIPAEIVAFRDQGSDKCH